MNKSENKGKIEITLQFLCEEKIITQKEKKDICAYLDGNGAMINNVKEFQIGKEECICN